MKIPWTAVAAFAGGLLILSQCGFSRLKDRRGRISILCGIAFVLFGVLSAIDANTTDQNHPFGRRKHFLLMAKTFTGGVATGLFLGFLLANEPKKPAAKD